MSKVTSVQFEWPWPFVLGGTFVAGVINGAILRTIVPTYGPTIAWVVVGLYGANSVLNLDHVGVANRIAGPVGVLIGQGVCLKLW